MRLALTPNRIALAAAALAAAHVACARSDVPIEQGEPVPILDASATPAPTASPSPPPQPTSTATAGPTTTPDYSIVAIPNGGFDADLSSWSASDPRWVTWQAGYARLNISGSSQAAAIAQSAQVPAASPVTLHFRYRSEAVESGPCNLEIGFGEVLSFPADQQWREALVDYTGNAGESLTVGVTAGSNDQCNWVNVDDFYWVVPIGSP